MASFVEEAKADFPNAYWRLGEASGTAAADESGNAQTGTYVNSPLLARPGLLAGDPDTAVEFVRSSSHRMDVADSAKLDLGDVFTIELLLRRRTATNVTQNPILGKSTGAYFLYLNSTGNIVLRKFGSADVCVSTVAINDTNKHHLIVGTGGASGIIQLDGVDVSGTWSDQAFANNSSIFQLNAAGSGTALGDFIFDEVLLYPTFLSAARRQAHYEAAKTLQMAVNFALSASFAATPALRYARAAQFAMALTLSAHQNRVLGRAVAFALSLGFAAQPSLTFIRAVQFALSLGLSTRRTLEMIRAYGLTATLQTPGKRLDLIRRYDIGLIHRALKEVRPIRTFGLSLSYRAAGTLSAAKATVRRNAEKFMQVLRGRRGTVPLTYRIVRSNIDGEDLGVVPGVISGTGSVSMSNFRDHAWELSFDMIQDPTGVFDPVRDYVKVYADVETGDDVQSYPLGLYRLAKPSGSIGRAVRTWNCQGYSLEDLLARDESDGPYSVPRGTDALQRAQDLIVSKARVPSDRVLFPAVSATLRHAFQTDAGGSTGSSWLSIVNALLNAAGYYGVQTDAEGNFVTEKMGSRTVLEPDISYDGSYERMVVGSVGDAWDDERFANKIVVKSQDVADTPPLVAKAFNRNPDSEGSINYLGRTIQKTISLQTAVSLAEMQVMAQAELEKASGYYRKLALSHLFDPRVFAPRRVYGVTLADVDGNVVVDGRWGQINASVNLSRPATAMTSEVSRIEEV